MPIGLFALTSVSPGRVAGTAIVTHVATGLLGSAAYLRSWQLRERRTRRIAAILAGVAVVGAPLGVLLNATVTHDLFGVLLGAFVGAIGVLVWVRARAADPSRPRASTGLRAPAIAALGSGVAALTAQRTPLSASTTRNRAPSR